MLPSSLLAGARAPLPEIRQASLATALGAGGKRREID